MRRAAALALAGLALAGVGAVSIVHTRGQLAVIEACDAAARGDVERALALTEARVGPTPTGRSAAECRCQALLAAGEEPACAAALEAAIGDPPEWSPRPELAELAVRARREAGREAEAAALASLAARAHPEDFALFRLELETRSAAESEEAVLAELAARVPERGESAARMRAALAQRHLMRGDAPAALRALGDAPPPGAGAGSPLWFDTLGIAHAMNDDLAAARAAYARWQAAGGRPREVRARYALALSVSGLADPELDPLPSLRGALGDALALGDARLAETVAVRLIYTLVASGRADAALAVHDEVLEHMPLEGVSRDELERAARADALAARGPGEPARGRVRFALAEGASAAELWISPDLGAEPDARYARHPLAPGRALELERSAGTAPQRWVLRSEGGATLGSGAFYPRAGEMLEIAVAPGPGPAPPPSPSLARQPADGRRRVALLLLDCGDWPIVQYLRTRGDLPTLDALFRTGHRAVLDSDPPLTAAALEALVWPDRRGDASLAGTVYRFGVELAGLESVGANPVEWLSWLLPESAGLFETVGAGPRRAANLLLAHGGVRAGRHGELHGPDGRRDRVDLGRSRRPLRAAERERFPELAALADPMDRHYVETMAAELDATEALLAAGDVDLLAVRIEPLDILTHAHFGAAAREGADHGRGLLFESYRYLDARIGALHRHLDADDVLVVFSDHGIDTAMEHSRQALFVATGAGIPPGRAPGRPALRGVSRLAADLLGVATDWPDTGVAPRASQIAEAPRTR